MYDSLHTALLPFYYLAISRGTNAPKMEEQITSNLSTYLSSYREKQIELIISQCSNPDVDTAVHEIRKSFKRLRTLELHLKSLDESLAMKRSDQWKMLGERLADPRDSAVMRYGIDHMLTDREQSYLSDVRNFLDLEYEKSIRELKENHVLAGIGKYIKKHRVLLNPVLPDTFILDDMALGVKDLFTDSLKKGKKANKKKKARFMHSWRKSLKHLQYQLNIFYECGTGELRNEEGYIKSITEQLGLFNDYSVLQKWLKSHKGLMDAGSYEAIRNRLKKRKKSLAEDAFKKGRALMKIDASVWWDFLSNNTFPAD